MLKYLLVFFITLACGTPEPTSPIKPETIVDSYSFEVSNAPSRNDREEGLNLLEEILPVSYLNIQGQLMVPNIPDEFNKELGCLDINLNDENYENYSSSLEVTTSGLVGQTFPLVPIFIFMLEGQNRVLLDPNNFTSIASFSPDSPHSYSAQICFELEYAEVPLQIYEGNINVQYKVEAEDLQTSDCSLSTDPSNCSFQEPLEIPQDDQSEDAEAENGEEESETSDGEESSNDGGDDGEESSNDSDEGGGDDGEESGSGDEDSSDNESNEDESQNDESTENDSGQGGAGEGNQEGSNEENETTEDADGEITQDPPIQDDLEDDPETLCEAIANGQNGSSEPITKSGSYFLEAKKYKIAGNKTTAMFYLSADKQTDAACLFLAGNKSNAQVIIDGSLGKLVIIGRGNLVSTTVLVNEGASINHIEIDFAGNNPSFTANGPGEFTCPDELTSGTIICD